jgi:hypothetical protein
LSQNPKVLAFCFIEKCEFVIKTDRNSIFRGREAHILIQLYIMVLYISFMSFLKIQILAQNPKMLVFGFTEKLQFIAKFDQNFVFLGHDAHIPDQLYIMIQYISF